MAYYLYREDGAGDSGPMCNFLILNKEGKVSKADIDYPEVGYAVQVGSLYARSYQYQDWWCTTPITEIIEKYKEDDRDVVKFKTRSGSIYTWKN